MTPLLKIAYEEGLYSQGTPDGWDEAALQRYGERIVRACAGVVADAVVCREPASTYVDKIKKHFGVQDAD
jgi:hypothetical protein